MDVVSPTHIGQIAIPVKDRARAVAFYRDALGLRFLFQAPPGLAFFECGGVRLMLANAESPEFDHPSSVLYFSVPDIQAAFVSFQGRGVTFKDQPHVITRTGGVTLWMTFFLDGEGNTLALMSEVKE